MKLSLKWLSEFVDLSGLTEKDIEEKLVKAGFEVEDKSYLGLGTNLIVGKVIECKNHPDSDHLHITKVDIGKEILDIVCGAPNCREGLKVIVAQVGAKLPGGEIKSGVIRGAVSNGMLCSLKELNIPENLLPENSCSFTGIEELDDSFEIGETDILNKLGLEDTTFEVAIYANRCDCLAMYYMAKEAAAILNRPCKLPSFENASSIGDKTNFKLDSKSKNCTHFLAKVINNVTIKSSPKWMIDHLKANGVKAINNLVDISNYVMLETGQPLHFYDLRSNPNKNITVVDDYCGEYTALDGVTYQIEKGDLMITSDNKPIGIAGIMGGDNTKILEDTKGLIIEAALFDNAQIRRTSNRLGLQTEAAARFSKGIEPLSQNKAMDRAVDLLIKYADAKEIEETVEYGSVYYKPYYVTETLSHLNSLIGQNYTMKEALSVIERLGFDYTNDDEKFNVLIPSYRSGDLKIREDIDEEIVRLTDFDSLKSTLPMLPQTVGRLSDMQKIRRTIREYMVNNGLNETISYTLVDQIKKDESCLPLGEAIALQSPLSDQRKYIRTSLMNSMIETLNYNLDHSNEDVNLFEISTVYANELMGERLGIVLNGSLINSKVLHLNQKANFYVMKGFVLELLANLGFHTNRINLLTNDLDTIHFHPYQSAVLKIGDKVIGIFGKLHPSFYTKNNDTYYAELMLDEIVKQVPAKVKAPIINKYPSISRDISIVVLDNVSSVDLIKTIKKIGGKLVKSVEVFDVYKGEHIKEGNKSISLNIVYESSENTLKTEEVNELHTKVLNELNKLFDANLR